MAANQRDQIKNSKADEPKNSKIDRNAPAGSENSLGAQSIRDGRPITDDSVVEAMDEKDPAIPPARSDKNKQ
jgi:hypothetical protein